MDTPKNALQTEKANQERGGAKRIPAFIQQLKTITIYGDKTGYSLQEIAAYRKTVNGLCKREIAYLRRKLTHDGTVNTQTLHRYVSDYRNAVRESFIDANMPDKYGDIRGLRKPTHIAVKYLSMTQVEKEKRKQSDVDAKNAYTDIDDGNRLVITNPVGLIETANNLLKPDNVDFYNTVIALLAVTGRRPIEILSTGSFQKSGANDLFFSGQAKTREAKHARGDFNIFVLANPEKVLAALKKIRTEKDFSGLTNRQIESRTSGYLGIASRKHFNHVLSGTDMITPKSLRGIWVNIAHQLFRPMSIPSVFATNQLGHATPDGQKVSRASADNYMQFYLPALEKSDKEKIFSIIS